VSLREIEGLGNKEGKGTWKKYNKKNQEKDQVRKLGRLGEEHIYTVRLCYCFHFFFVQLHISVLKSSGAALLARPFE